MVGRGAVQGAWPSLAELQGWAAAAQSRLSRISPRLERLMSEPGAQEMAEELRATLLQRFIARTIKAVFGGSPDVSVKSDSASNFTRVSE